MPIAQYPLVGPAIRETARNKKEKTCLVLYPANAMDTFANDG